MQSRKVIETLVDEMISKGIVDASARDTQIQTLTADERQAEFWANSFLRQQDYTRKTMSIAEERKKFEEEQQAKLREIEHQRANLQMWERDTRAEIDRLRNLEGTAFAQTEKLARMEQVLRDYGLADQIPTVDIPSTPTSSPAPASNPPETRMSNNSNNSNEPAYISREEAAAALQNVMQLNSRAMIINNRHQQLFGQPLTDDIVSESLKSGVDIEQYWRTKYGVDTREAALQDERARQERERIREELRAELMKEYAVDPSRVISGTSTISSSPGHILERYSASRAVAPTSAEAPATSSPAPEMRPDLGNHQSRVGEAISFFRQNFTPDGTPITGDSRRT